METSATNREFQEQLASLRQTDNHTNWLFIGRAWLIIGLAIGGFAAFDAFRASAGWHLAWDLPLLAIALLVIGASQHQLAAAGHEATHRTLFRDRRLNEWISDWFCMYPILTTTELYRRQHLAHHLHVNDPALDPDLAQLEASGHDFDYPMSPGQFAQSLLRQLWPPNLVRYLFHRARYSAAGGGQDRKGQSWPDRLFFPWGILLLGTLGLMAHFETPPWTFYAAAGAIGGTVLAVLAGQANAAAFFRYFHGTVVVLGLTLIHVYTGLETLTFYVLLWLLPLVSSFGYFMMLRQTIQHANCDEGRFTNTRVFHVNPLLRYAIFPLGMDYHLPHHLYASVPHYRLRALHQLLQVQPEYRSEGSEVENFFPSSRNAEFPAITDVLAERQGPDSPAIDPTPVEKPGARA